MLDRSADLDAEQARWLLHAEPLADLRQSLIAEFRAHESPEDAIFGHFRLSGREVRVVVPSGASYPVVLEDAAGLAGSVTTLLDLATESRSEPQFLVGTMWLDPEGRYLMYTVDVDGSDRYEVRLRDLSKGVTRTLATSAGAAVAWDGVAERVVYLELDEDGRPMRIRSVAVDGTDMALVHQGTYDDGFVDVVTAGDGISVLASDERHDRRSVFLLDLGGSMRTLWQASEGEFAFADCVGSQVFLLLFREDGSASRLLVTDRRALVGESPPQWCTLAESPTGRHWEEFAARDGWVLIAERTLSGHRLVRIDTGSGLRDEVNPVGLPVGSWSPALVPGFCVEVPSVHVVLRCWQVPDMTFRVKRTDARPVESARLAETGAFAVLDVVNRIVTSSDGTDVPLTVLRPPGATGPLPTVLYAYGAYGIPVDPAFSPFRLSLAARGIAFAIAHVRGGGDLGPAWHAAGRGLGKRHAVEDYLACARYLSDRKLTTPGGLVARARSAGGAIVGAAVNAAPEIFAAAVLEAPFVDCLRTLSDPGAALTVLEWQEWGNPLANQEDRDGVAALSPVDNVRPAGYPVILVTTGRTDARVLPREALRYVRAVRAATTAGRPALLKVYEAGHLGHSDVEEDAADEADVLAFIIDEVARAASRRTAGGIDYDRR